MTRILLIVVAVIAVGVGTAVWFASTGGESSDASREFFTGPQTYDTTGGQDMRPRWNSREGQDDAGD